jgi:hypothetical protein
VTRAAGSTYGVQVSAARVGLDGLAADFVEHRSLVGDSNAVVARELVLLESLLCGPQANAPIVERLGKAWRSRTFRAYYERPLLLAAALRLEAMQEGSALAPALASPIPDISALTTARLASALDPDRLPIWLTLATRKVQTNDVSRAMAWRWPATLGRDRPLVLVDVGCSAGLGLVADRLAIMWTDDAGRPLPRFGGRVVARLGFDADPGDPRRPADVQWLRACVWPGDNERLARLDDAIAAFVSAAERGEAPVVERVRAKQVPARLQRIERACDPGALVLVVQSFVREYLDASEAEPYATAMAAFLSSLPVGRAMWVQLELSAPGDRPPAEIVAHASGGAPVRIGRCGYHPQTVVVDRDGLARLRETIAAFSARR